MITFLFWNLRGRQSATWEARWPNLRARLVRMATAFEIDVFIFAEPEGECAGLSRILEVETGLPFGYCENAQSPIQVHSRLPGQAIRNAFDSLDGRLTIRRIRAGSVDWLLAAIHVHSPQHWDSYSQAKEMELALADLERVEEERRHDRTIFVGDFNMDPFDTGMTAASALNAAMTAQLATEGPRTVARREYRWFYNPMWGHFGDRTSGPPGSYYYRRSDHTGAHWHLFDQVLLRPALIGSLAEVRVLDTDGVDSLATPVGRPRERQYSDHYPLLFRLRTEGV